MKIVREEGRGKEGVTEYIWHENRVGGYLGGGRGPASAMRTEQIGTKYDTYV